eukprot:CAMPEP_0197080818 /NCGR_PEP_ID=MMETSP1384-20130603/214323_1 /TAXON_ID=29189 /ORGANISM="Ammonia sp." /LENGTH=374 /DNA_ID=CAMNT_0042519709 /DNA_START=986 /DNA_END=2110 /DNA_ORIENTATION=+
MHMFSYIVAPLTLPVFAAFAVVAMAAIAGVTNKYYYHDDFFVILMACICCPCLLAVYLIAVAATSCFALLAAVALCATMFAPLAYNAQSRFKYVTRVEVNEMVNFCVEFINHRSTAEEKKLYSYPENDRVMRILSVNRAYHSLELDAYGAKHKDNAFVKYLMEIATEHSWADVTEDQIAAKGQRGTVYQSTFWNEYLKFVRGTYEPFMNVLPSGNDVNCSEIGCVCFCCLCGIPFLLALILVTALHLLLLAFLLTRFVVILYPVLVLLDAADLYGLQWVIWFLFTAFYVATMVIEFKHAVPTFAALHLIAGLRGSVVNLIVNSVAPEAFRQKVHAYYGIVQLTKYVQEVLEKRFGDDVALIIVEYAFENWMKKK